MFRLAILSACCLTLTFAAGPGPQSAPGQVTPLRVTTRLVQVNVVVQDKKGEAITDLTRDDFEVSEQGKTQAISAFSIESNRTAIGRAEGLPLNTFSNMPSRAGASQNLTAILFDTLNTPIKDQAVAKKGVLRFLQQLKPEDRVAVYGLATSLQVIHDFTGDSGALVRAVDHYSVRSSMEQTGSIPAIEDNTWLAENEQEAGIIAAMDAFLNQSNRLIADYFIERRTATTLQALEMLANHLAFLPGRKSLVWVSAGFPFVYGSTEMKVNQFTDGMKNSAQVVARTARSITNANVAIYPVDARALMGAAIDSPRTNAALVTNTARQAAALDAQVMDEVLASRGTLTELANQTGGRAVYNTGDVEGAIRQVLEDARVTYTLGYYPADTKFDGKFRNIKVSVKRPGAQLKYRRGYYAFPDETPKQDSAQRALIDASASPLDATGIVFLIEVGKASAGNGARQLVMETNTNTIKLEPVQENWAGGLDALFVQLDKTGKILSSAGRKIPLKLTAADRAQLLQDGLVLNLPITLKGDCDHLRVVLRDVTSGAIGTVTVPTRSLRF
jgi:VWFA-related protein